MVRSVRHRIDIIARSFVRNSEVRKVAVTTQGTRVHFIRTLAEHDYAAILRHEDPARRLGGDPEGEHLHVEIADCRSLWTART
jgi:hypothetical protein